MPDSPRTPPKKISQNYTRLLTPPQIRDMMLPVRNGRKDITRGMFRQPPDDYQAEIDALKEQYEERAAVVEDQAKHIAELEESVRCLRTYAAAVYNDYLKVYYTLKDIIESLNSSKHILPELFSPDAGKDS